MAFCALFLIALIHQSYANAQASWKKVSVTGSYPGRGETAFSRCGDAKLCLLGGRGSNRVHILDTDKLEWSPGQTNSVEMHHFQGFQGPDECVWVVGAWTGPYPNERTVDNIWRYCPDSGEWFKGDRISRPRGSGGAFYHNGKVYLVTGNVGGHREGAMVVPWFDSYNPKTGKWEQLPDIPHARDHCHAVVRNNKLYVAGGRRSTSKAPEFFDDTVAEVDVYDFGSGKWSTITSLDRPRGGTASAVYRNAVYLIGGEGDNRAWTEVDVLGNGGFKNSPSLPEPRHGTGVVSCNGAIWIAGGARVLGGGNNAQDTYAFFEGNDPPACHSHEVKRLPATPDSSEEPSNSVIELNDSPEPSASFFVGLTETPTPAPLVEATSPVTIPTESTGFFNPVESILPELSSSPEFSDEFSSEEQQEPISIEASTSPDPSPSEKPHESASQSPEGLQPFKNTSDEILGDDVGQEKLAKDRRTPRKGPYGVFTIAESTAPFEEALTFESPRPSPMTVEDVVDTSSDSSAFSEPSSSATPDPTSLMTFVDSDSPTIAFTPDSEEVEMQDESSTEPIGSKVDISHDIVNEVSPEPTALIETIPAEEDSPLVWTEEPQGSSMLLEEELFNDLEPSSEFEGETSSCFPSNALVELEDGSTKSMAFLRIGDRVKVAHPDVYSEVFFFSHKHPDKNSKFLELKTSVEGVSLTLSHNHLVQANGVLVEASAVRVGDRLLLGNEAKAAFVTDVLEIKSSGLHHPHTMHGDIVVNGVVASTFTSAIHPSWAKVLLSPFKAAFYVFQNKVKLETLNMFVLRTLDIVWWEN